MDKIKTLPKDALSRIVKYIVEYRMEYKVLPSNTLRCLIVSAGVIPTPCVSSSL